MTRPGVGPTARGKFLSLAAKNFAVESGDYEIHGARCCAPSEEDYVIRRLSFIGLVIIAVLVLGYFGLPSLHRNVPASRPPQDTEENSEASYRAQPAPSPLAPASATVVNAAAPEPPSAPEAAAKPTPLPQPAAQAMQGVSDIDAHQAEGSRNAPIIMEVFSDYQCPACKNLFLTTDRLLVDNYVNTGKVYLIHRDYPLPMHAYSRVAARYGRASAQLGKLDAVEVALFQSQEKWEVSGDVDGTVAAALSPTEMNKVRALVKGGTLDAMIDKDYALGQIYHVNQTPTTILHAKGQTYPVVGVVTFDVLHTFLDQLLSQK
jgi:protein-disulfide isomerase